MKIEHLQLFNQGKDNWNKWRDENPHIKPDLSSQKFGRGLDLKGWKLSGTNFSRSSLIEADFRPDNEPLKTLKHICFSSANLAGADFSNLGIIDVEFSGATLNGAKFEGSLLNNTNFSHAKLIETNLNGINCPIGVDFSGAELRDAKLIGATLINSSFRHTDLTAANFSNADLTGASFIDTNCESTNFSGCRIYGISVWDLKTNKDTNQENLIIEKYGQQSIVVDNIEVAQLVYLILHYPNLRKVIGTVGKLGVLILGRFTPERLSVLHNIRDELRRMGYLPIIFDFERPPNRTFTETILTLAGLSRFVIADITNPSSSPLELQALMPNFQIPLAPIIQRGEKPFSMFQDLLNSFNDRTLEILEYSSSDELKLVLKKAIVDPALKLSDNLLEKKQRLLKTRDAQDFIEE